MSDRSDWNEPWFDTSVWIFEHLQELNLSPNEALLIMVINYYNRLKRAVTYDELIEKCHMDADAIEECFESLSAKGYMYLDFHNKNLRFLLDGLMDTPIKQGRPINQALIQEFQEEFRGRTLSSSEMERILEMGDKYDERMILQALSEAAAYDKRSISYVESVLQSWTARGLSAEDVEAGRR